EKLKDLENFGDSGRILTTNLIFISPSGVCSTLYPKAAIAKPLQNRLVGVTTNEPFSF
ncbi:MAG: hypothetical protein US31_C0023G0009, partial [Berkelbacteria bacterium GW2011_GWA1_36_9]